MTRKDNLEQLNRWAQENLVELCTPSDVATFSFRKQERFRDMWVDECVESFLFRVENEARKRFGVSTPTAKDYARNVYEFHKVGIQRAAVKSFSEGSGPLP